MPDRTKFSATIPVHLSPRDTQAKCPCGYIWQPRSRILSRCPSCGERVGIQVEAKTALPSANAGARNTIENASGPEIPQLGWEKASAVALSGNPYPQRLQDLNLVSLDEEVRAVFPTSEAVNEALRLLIKVARASEVAKVMPEDEVRDHD